MNQRILATELFTGPGIERLAAEFEFVSEPKLWHSPEQLRARLGEGFDAILVRNQTRVTAEVIHAAGPRLKVIARAGVGLETVDVQAATEAGIVVAFAPEQNAVSVAELTLGLMLALARQIPAADRNTREGGWDRQRFTGVELFQSTLGLVGLGRIGFRVGMRAKAFGMEIIAYDAFAQPDSFMVAELGARLVTLDELLARADFVSCHVPDTAETRGMFDEARFQQMKRGAFFINTARGTAVVEPALAAALRDGRLGGAALDVRQQEPPASEGDPFADLENVILSPHVAAFTREGQERVLTTVFEDVRRVLRGEGARNFANFAKPRRT